ncbi:type 2 lanthipeptide synthetase LanM family protein [Halorussus lipolyticus]|uniref:type 2 lanthipeptide synthetase LanM family protein n=1 Tax=Halorussus lipolyticus TaxID=3034024 RepID=UPI0023E8C1E2|nr:type 2 lanthipeptide synthetase LanM family protein [Halorussus sp. DT80]
MTLISGERREIAAGAQSLRARLESSDAGAGLPDEEIADLVELWADNVADGDHDGFAKRLDRDELTESDVRNRLEAGQLPDDDSVPDWMDTVNEIHEYVATTDPPTLGPAGDESPFEHVLAPIVEYATARLDCRPFDEQFGTEATEMVRQSLHDRLQTLTGQVLFIEFKKFLETEEFADDGPRPGYRAFVGHQLETGLRGLFLEYPVLARLTVTFVENWLAGVAELATRLERDRSELEAIFADGDELGPVTAVESTGDYHASGRCVFRVEFGSGVTLAYKPRPIEPEATFNRFLSWVNDESDLLDFRTMTCLARDGYGWVEWITSESCPDTDAVSRYYRRVGMLVAILYSLQFVDGNLENVLVAGEHPMILDLETVFHPVRSDPYRLGDENLFDIIEESVVSTGIVPVDLSDQNMEGVGGIDAEEAVQSEVVSRVFTDVNTDQMELEFENTVTIEGQSIPRIDGEPEGPRDYPDDIVTGFEEAYRFLLDARDRMLADDGPISWFEDTEVRFIYRSSGTYGRTRRPMVTSRYLRSGARCGARIELLTSWFDFDDHEADLWRLYEAERDALWEYDIPRLTVNTSDTRLFHRGNVVSDTFDSSPVEQVRDRIESMSEADLREQSDYLRLGYDPDPLRNPSPPADFDGDPDHLDAETAERTARDIFSRLREDAVWNDGDRQWYTRTNTGNGLYVHPLRDDLYEGRVGIGLYSSALASVFGGDEYRSFAEEAVAPVLAEVTAGDYEARKFGACHGVGSLVYGFTKMADLLGDDRYADAALELSTEITPEALERDDSYDLIGGTAGGILGLLALYDRVGDDALLERATAAGEYLLSNRIESDGVQVWNTDDGEKRTLNGSGHGVAGIALALFELGHVADAPRFADVAMESLAFEDHHYSCTHEGWPDFRFGDYRPGWCAGSSGIGLARLRMLEIEERDSLRRDVERALDGIDHRTLADRDHICCGNFSRVEFLLEASRTLGDDRYRRQAETLASAVLRRADDRDGFAVPWQTDHWYTQSLFLGEPGIGYSLLRLTDADLPSLLVFE